MDPYRAPTPTQPSSEDYSPRVVLDEPIYVDRDVQAKRVRVVRVHVQAGDKLVRSHIVEFATKRTAVGELAWEPLTSFIMADEKAALEALARGLDREVVRG